VPGQDNDIWPPFVRTAVGLALTPGFGLGGMLFAAPALGLPVGAWWPAAAQVHAHVQLFGWAGLMVLGVAFHFLPRLRGRPLAHRERAPAVLWLLAGGPHRHQRNRGDNRAQVRDELANRGDEC
jgi:uncharacterized protein involved in response to NO